MTAKKRTPVPAVATPGRVTKITELGSDHVRRAGTVLARVEWVGDDPMLYPGDRLHALAILLAGTLDEADEQPALEGDPVIVFRDFADAVRRYQTPRGRIA